MNMGADLEKGTGLTQDSGWQIGLKRTLPIPFEILWDWMLSKNGLNIWLGEGPDFRFQAGETYELDDGTRGKVRVYKINSHWRLTRQPNNPEYKRPSVIQIRILESGDNTMLAFHEEHLPTQTERQARKTFYLGVVEKIKAEFILG